MRRDELIGRTIANRFRIQRVLGEGGMATVFVAEQDAEPRQVALKILRAELTSDKTFAKRFEREAKAAARVQHPNSVTIFDAGVEGSLSYIAMELLRGDDLYALLERHRVLSPRSAAHILAEVCEALAVAHGLGIVHRDLKPENIMIVHDGEDVDPGAPNSVLLPPGARVKVLDFGIAKLLDKPAEPPRPRGDDLDPPSQLTAVTRVGTLIGTPAYMSPEQCAQLPVDTRSDIYTCGVLLFQLVTGRLPFEGPTPLHIAMKHIHEEPPPLRSIVPEADPALEALILKALAKKATERHPNARYLGAALRRLLPKLPDAPYPSAHREGGDFDEITMDSLSADTDTPVVSAAPEGMASAKTVVADGLSRIPASVLVHEGAIFTRRSVSTDSSPTAVSAAQASPPPHPDVEAEPDDLASTLVRPSMPEVLEADIAFAATHEAAAAGRQLTMQSAQPAGPAIPAQRPARISVVEPPVAAAIPQPAPPGVRPSAPPQPVVPMASVILAPSLSAAAPPAPSAAPVASLPAMPPSVPVRSSVVPAPTFGLPPAPAGAAEQSQMLGRFLWIGILIGTAVSAVVFTVAYLLFLSR